LTWIKAGRFSVSTSAPFPATVLVGGPLLERLIPVLLLSLSSAPAIAAPGAVARGGALVQQHCAPCHAVGRTGASPEGRAPPFRELHKRYDVQTLEEALAEGIVTGHNAMPEFRFEPAQIADIIGYLKSLER
jgi:mono/diheme cytochrome c family protein